MAQQPIFTINILAEEPPQTQTADLKIIGHGDDSHKYAIKTIEDNPLLPITEWFCHHLCRAVGIATPDFFAVYRQNGTIAFGSRFELNAEQFNPASNKEPALAMLERLFGSDQRRISAIFGVDFFLPNDDRHLGNFLFRESGRRLTPLAFDFSRSWLVLGLPFGKDAWGNDSKSALMYKLLVDRNYISKPEILIILDKIEQLPNDFAQKVIESAPTSWLLSFDKRATINYWENNRKDRINIARSLI
jgi:hypothetical protein